MTRPRLLIEEWLPAQAIGIECARERSTGQQPPDKRLHVWWARRPLTASRAAVLASLLPADFDRGTFERLLGFYASSATLVQNEAALEVARATGINIKNPHGLRAFKNKVRDADIQTALDAIHALWGEDVTVIDPMAGGGSIPLEAARLGLTALANEYNPVACSVLEATVDYPFRFGAGLAEKTRKWAKVWHARFVERMADFYETAGIIPAYTYIFTRTIPCPDTGHLTPLVSDWTLLRKGKLHLVAEPLILDKSSGTWTIRIRQIGKGAGQLRNVPPPTYKGGKCFSLFSGGPIPPEYIKAMAQYGRMNNCLYAVVTKASGKLEFRPAEAADLNSLTRAEQEFLSSQKLWESNNVVPTEERYRGECDRSYSYGMTKWSSLFTSRQLLAAGILVEELRRLQVEIDNDESTNLGHAIHHLLSIILDKVLDYSNQLTTWEVTTGVAKHIFQRHDYSFKTTFAEMELCASGGGVSWAIDSVLEAYEDLVALPKSALASSVSVNQGSATNLLHLADGSITCIVVDPPYADNVQYAELADFFYVWQKRVQGNRRPEWFSTYLCETDEEAVVNPTRFGGESDKATGDSARVQANRFYQAKMAQVFRECHRVLRNDGVLTVMFTHKKQEAWAALFESLIEAGFTITATWPVQTESQHSLHQARKNAAQSTVILAARKRSLHAGYAYFDQLLQAAMREKAQTTAARLQSEGLNAVDQLVGAFGPAMEVFTQYDSVRTDTGQPVTVADAIQFAATAVADWRVEQLARRGLEGVDAESRFVLLCWDVLGAAEFRFNEAMMLGRSVGMDVATLEVSGLIARSGDKVKLLSAAERRRQKPVKNEQEQPALLDIGPGKQRTKKSSRQVHPADEVFASAIDMCHVLALRYWEAGGGQAGIGAARSTAVQQGWNASSPCARLMEALVSAAPSAVRFTGKSKTAADDFPEFRAWHALLQPLFKADAPAWQAPVVLQPTLLTDDEEAVEFDYDNEDQPDEE